MSGWCDERIETLKGDIGCVIVCYNTPNIITTAVNSIKKHVDRVVIVDNSTNVRVIKECDRLKKGNVDVIHIHKNIGHGPGLNIGITFLRTEYIICMDSDAKLKDKSLIPEMKSMISDNVYGVGFIEKIVDNIDYLHPYFCMFKRRTYFDYPPFIHHGAPFCRTMIKVDKKVLPVKNILERCLHTGKGTRKITNNITVNKWETHL